ncbi:hypothetical protein SLA2020_321430 [Shorea laevis]
MGNYRFRLSDMMPNAWFYKLKDMSRVRNRTANTKKKQQPEPSKPNKPHQNSYPRKSYYFSRELVSNDRLCNSPRLSTDPPRKSSRRIRSRRLAAAGASPKLVSSSVSSGSNCRASATLRITPDSQPPEHSASYSSDGSLELELGESFPPEFRTDRILTTDSFDDMVALSRSQAKEVVIDVGQIELPPIITKPEQFNDSVKELKMKEQHKEPTKYGRSSLTVNVKKEERITMKEQRNTTPVRKFSSNSPGMKLRINSPRIANRKILAQARKSVSSSSSAGLRSSRRSLSESLAVVKSSFDPQRDFRESMVEMIVQNNIRSSKDLEDLLACYLTLNSGEYHDLIIKVFKQIWFDLSDHIQLK